MNKKMHTICSMLLLSIFFGGCETIDDFLGNEKPSATIKGLKFEDITLDSATLAFDVELKNPYSSALPLTNLDYGLTSDEKSLLSGSAELQSTIPANSTKTISLPAKINYLDLIRAFKGIRPGSKIPYKANLGLSVDTPVLGSMRLPLDKQGELTVPTIPEAADINWKKIILDKVGNRQ